MRRWDALADAYIEVYKARGVRSVVFRVVIHAIAPLGFTVLLAE